MANENHQNDVPQQVVAPQPSHGVPLDAQLGNKGAARRRFTRTGAGAAGVLLTLTSQPGMACSVNVGPSGYQSAIVAAKNGMKVSHAPTTPSAGLPPDRWKAGAGWPCATTKRFGNVFSCNYANYALANTALQTLCAGTSSVTGDKAIVAKYLAAAYLNVLSGRSPFLTLQHLQAIWAEYQTRQTYTPMAGATPWNSSVIKAYLYQTMD